MIFPSLASAQHIGDAQLQVENGKIVTGSAEFDVGSGTTVVTMDEYVFGSLLTNPYFRSSDPGFDSTPTGSPILPAGIEGFPVGAEVMFDILPIEGDGVTANFLYWDGLDQGTDGVGPEDVDFGAAAQDVTWTLIDYDFDRYTADGGPDMVPGGLIGVSNSSGRMHEHLPFDVDYVDAFTTPPQGVYLASLQARAAGYETSDPFFFVHRSPTMSEAVLDVAIAWVDDHYDVLAGFALWGDFNADGAVDAADYTVWRDTGGPIEDYNTWVAHYGESLGGSSTAVPEPATWALAVGIVAQGVACSRRRRQSLAKLPLLAQRR